MLDHNYLYYKPIEQDDVILILGATHGDFIREHRNEILEKNAFVINVEPTLEGVASLASYIKSAMPENACVLSCAVSSYSGYMKMDIRSNLITSTLEDRPETNERWPMPLLYKCIVPVIRLDDIPYVFNRKVTKLFMDIEGSEIEVLGTSEFVEYIPYIAAAAYHIRDNKPTYERLSEWFSNSHKVLVTGEASNYNKNEVVFFAMKEG